MAKQEQTSGRIVVVILLVLFCLLLPLLYILSSGPAVWLVAHGYLSHTYISWFYHPVDYLMRLFPETFGDWMNRYLEGFL